LNWSVFFLSALSRVLSKLSSSMPYTRRKREECWVNQKIHKFLIKKTLFFRMYNTLNITIVSSFLNQSRDVSGSVLHSIIHKEIPTRCNSISNFYFIFMCSLVCFGRHTAHHQEPKTVLAASGFACVEGCWTCSCWTLPGRIKQPSTYAKPEAASALLGSWWWAVCRAKHDELHINMK
jgi:hypothetical protein